jgi:hypothetical protein
MALYNTSMFERNPISTNGPVIPVLETHAGRYERGGAHPVAHAGDVCEFDGIRSVVREGYVAFDPKDLAEVDWSKVLEPQVTE